MKTLFCKQKRLTNVAPPHANKRRWNNPKITQREINKN